MSIRTGQTQVNQDFLTNPKVSVWRELALKRGIQSSIALPLRKDSNVIGFLSTYAREPEAFDRNETSLLELLAADIEVRLSEFGTERVPANAS